MKIAVLGAGAMGSLLGGLLAEGGHEVTLISTRAEHVELINREGLFLEDPGGGRRVGLKACLAAAEAGPAELVIVAVKAPQTREAMAGALSLVSQDTLVLTLQNGLGNVENLVEAVGPGPVVAGTSNCGAHLKGPGRVRHAGGRGVALGELSGLITGRLLGLGRVFEESGFAPVSLSDNVLSLLWGKLLINVAINAVTALARIRNGQILDFPETAEISRLAVLEAVEVARRKGIALPGDPVGNAFEVARETGANFSSMLQDVARQRPTEIDFINGAVVREGEALGVPTPVNKVLAGLVSVYQRTCPKEI
ncbi:MAG: 2-dehydropantoate 2-reductase [Candidatus Adiutrix sp.]|jgi:2-dehydropantoate 2-reductase|nr:2-dehydropantoate 2-reductase [Candidatus Adiutrix sp.]